MGPRLVCGTFDDIRSRCAIAPVRRTHNEPGYDDGALVPGDTWSPPTADEDQRLRAGQYPHPPRTPVPAGSQRRRPDRAHRSRRQPRPLTPDQRPCPHRPASACPDDPPQRPGFRIQLVQTLSDCCLACPGPPATARIPYSLRLIPRTARISARRRTSRSGHRRRHADRCRPLRPTPINANCSGLLRRGVADPQQVAGALQVLLRA